MKVSSFVAIALFLQSVGAAQSLTCNRAQWLANTNASAATAVEDFEAFTVEHNLGYTVVPIAVGTLQATGPVVITSYIDVYPFTTPSPDTWPGNNGSYAHVICTTEYGSSSPFAAPTEIRIDLANHARAIGFYIDDAFTAPIEGCELLLFDGPAQVGATAPLLNTTQTTCNCCPSGPPPNGTFFGASFTAGSGISFNVVVLRSAFSNTNRSEMFSLDDIEVVDAACWMPTSSYCTAGTTTNGCVPSLSYVGSPHASASSGFVISATGVEGQKSGFFYFGMTSAQVLPWGVGGTSSMCVLAPVQRMGTQSSGGNLFQCDGTFSQDWNAFMSTHPSALGSPLTGGEDVWLQAWIRDPPAPKTSSLSDALYFQVCP